MQFMLVNGKIEYPKFRTKDGIGLRERPENEELCERFGVVQVELPSQKILQAVEGKYFERYSEAKEFLASLEESVNG